MKKIKDIIVELFNRNSKSRIIVLGIVSILLVFLMLVGNTYSIFVSSNVDENVNVYKTGNLDVTYTLSEDNIGFDDIKPTSIEESIKIKPYRVTVNNAGTVPYMFDLILQDTTSTESISSEYIMVQVGKLEPIKLASTTNNIIKEDIIVPAGDSVIVDVRVWLSDEVKNTEIGKSFYAKLVLDGLAVYADSSDIDNSVLIANRLLSEMEAGSYVLYTGNNGCVGEYCSGENVNNDESNSYCLGTNADTSLSGFRLAYIDNGNAHIVSAGAVECICTSSDGEVSNSHCDDCLNSNDLYKHIDNINNVSLKYCNSDYAYLGTCNTSTVWGINGKDFSNIIGDNLFNCLENNDCGRNNSLINNGMFYWYSTSLESSYPFVFYWDHDKLYVDDAYTHNIRGVRPVIKLDTTVVVTGGTGIEDDPYTIENVIPNSLKAFNSEEDNSYFHNEAYRTTIKNISFVDYIDTSGAVEIWDMSRSNNESIIAWVTNNVTSGYYDLYIGSEKPIKGINLAYYFSSMTNVDSIDFSNLDTSITKDMSVMFFETGYNSSVFKLDLGNNFDTSNVTNMGHMFDCTGYNNPVFTLDLGDKFDTSNVTDMNHMFNALAYSNTSFTLDLGDKFDTSNVKNMYAMFNYVGYNSTVFTLDLGDKFDTSNAIDMFAMFQRTGYSSTVFKLDLGDKFNTSKVVNMGNMFAETGYKSPVFTLNLGSKFDTSNVTDMARMFGNTGYSSTVFTLDLGDKFDTSNVTNMGHMFEKLGYSSTIFTLELGEKFNTQKVTEMTYMFEKLGYSSTVLTLDLGDKFYTSKVTDMNRMFSLAGYCSTIFTLDLGEYFDTSNVTDMTRLFAGAGDANNDLVLDLSSFTFDNVSNYGSMFSGFKATQKIYVKNASDQTWITSKGFSNVTTSNVLVKS